MEAISILKIILEEGAKYAILAMGVYLTYSILDFPDLSVDGTMPLGAIVSTVMILKGVNPWVSLLAAFASGCLAGCVTGVLHVKLKIRPLLCGILVYTSLLSVNLIIVKWGTDGQSIASIFGYNTIFTDGLAIAYTRIGRRCDCEKACDCGSSRYHCKASYRLVFKD